MALPQAFLLLSTLSSDSLQGTECDLPALCAKQFKPELCDL